jgi:hypothetical protein
MNVKPPVSPASPPVTPADTVVAIAKPEKNPLVKPDVLLQSAQDNKDKNKIDTAKGQAKPHIQFEPDYPLNSSHHPDGGITVQGFPAGNPPALKDILEIAFPFAKDVKVLGSNHQRPFDTYALEVDGKPFTASFLYGGIVASDSFQIKPGKSELPMEPTKTKEIKNKLEKAQIQVEDNTYKKYERIISTQPGNADRLDAPKVELKKNGGMRVNFEKGRANLDDALRSAFPDAKDLRIVGSSHMRPFDSYHVMVDGKPFTAAFLWGGIVASNQFDIDPGHTKLFD